MSIVLGNFVQTTTREKFFNTAVDNIFTGNNLLGMFMRNSRPWTGGRQLKKTTYLTKSTTGGSYSGFDAFDVTQEDTRQIMFTDPVQYYWSLELSGIQKAVNKGAEAFIDLIAQEFEEKTKAIKDVMGDDLYGDGTGNNNKAMNGLIYHIDDSTYVTTYQGLSRSTYPTLKATLSEQSGALAFSDIAADYDACQVGSDNPTLGVTTPAVWTIMEALISLTHNMEINKSYPTGSPTGLKAGAGISGSVGLNSIYFRGVPIISDEKCISGNFFFLNMNHLWMYNLAQDPLFVSGTRNGFGWTGWKKGINQDVIVGQLLWYGQLFGDSPRTMSRRTAITS